MRPLSRHIAAIRAVLQEPVAVAVLHDNYRGLGAARKLCDAPVIRGVKQAAKPGPDALPAGGAACATFAHTLKCVSQHVHHAHPDVRRWAELARAILAIPDAVETLGGIADSDAHLQQVVCGVLNWVIAECNRCGAPSMPFRHTSD